MRRATLLLTSVLLTCLTCPAVAQPTRTAQPTQAEAVEALHKAVAFFREHASADGGYVYQLSADLSKREGEGVVTPTIAWIEPPGTPAVGMAYLEAYRLTDDPLLLEAAIATGTALVRGQLDSGGWDNMIEFDPQQRSRYSYRIDGNPERKTRTTFDDDKSQSALRFLMHLDRQLEGRNKPIAEAVRYAQEAFLKAQYPNGAWPQRYREFPEPQEFPVKRASYPHEWPREFPSRQYAGYYTLNDNTISDLIDTMLEAYDLYGDERFLNSARHGGDFFLLAQMPDPQPGWCQQYNLDMQPAWARKFEPPAITGGESQAVMQTLLRLYERTGDRKYLAPIPRALDYYQNSLLEDGRLARFYELETNRPLYFTLDYKLTYSDDDMPTHYAFQVSSRLDRIARDYERIAALPADQLKPRTASLSRRPGKLTDSLQAQARRAIDSLDERGAWVEKGSLRYHQDDDTSQVITSQTFSRNLLVLAEFIAASAAEK
jgi:hypothetical protein